MCFYHNFKSLKYSVKASAFMFLHELYMLTYNAEHLRFFSSQTFFGRGMGRSCYCRLCNCKQSPHSNLREDTITLTHQLLSIILWIAKLLGLSMKP